MKALAFGIAVIFMIFGSSAYAESTIETGREGWRSPFESDVSVIRTSCDNSAGLPPVGNQEVPGSCYAWAVAYYHGSYLQGQDYGWDLTDPAHQLSPAFVYNLTNGGRDNANYDGQQPRHDAFNVLETMGCATMADMPYSYNGFREFPSEEAFRNGITFRTLSTHTISLTSETGIQALKDHLLAGNTAVMGIYGYSNYNDIGAYDNIYCVNDISGGIIFWHEVCIVGFDDSLETNDGMGAFRFVNSFGPYWGDDGFFWMSYEAVADSRTSFRYAMYATDRPAYEPTLLARLEVEHDDRYMLRYTAGLGQPDSPEITLDFFDFTPASYHPGLPYPSDAALVLDLTALAVEFDSLVTNHVYMSVRDLDDMDDRTGTMECLWLEDVATDFYAISPTAPLPIPEADAAVTAHVSVNYTLSAPEQLSAELDSLPGVVELSWLPPSDAGLLLGYYVYRNGIRIDSTLTTAYSEHIVGAGIHSYAVSARHPGGESFQIQGTVSGGGNAYGLPYADAFETGLGGWFQAGNCGLDATITSEPVYSGEYAVSMKTVGLGNTFLIRPADTAEGVAIKTWINVEALPEVEEAFSAGIGWLNQGGGMSGVFIGPEGTCSYTYPSGGGQEAVTLDSAVVVQQEVWYQQRLRYLDGLLHVTTLDTSWNVLLNQAVSIPAQDAVGVVLGAGALDDAASYFDDLVADEWLGEGVNHFYPPMPGPRPYALVITEATTGDGALEPGDEIGVFDGSRCVGAAIVEEAWPSILHAWAATDSTHGYNDGNPILFRLWVSAEDRFYVGEADFELGGTFGDGLFSRLRLEAGEEVAADQMIRIEPVVYSLSPATPNPFATSTTMQLSLPEAMRVRVAAYDMSGREVSVVAEGWHEAGNHALKLPGHEFADGAYLIRAVSSDDRVASRTVIVLR